MHPLIHLALKQYVEARHGVKGWLGFLDLAGVSTATPYVRVGDYPDEEFYAIIAAVARGTGATVEEVIEDFGMAIASELITMYPRLVRPEWRSLDLICNTEQTIHAIVRQGHAGARPPALKCLRVSATELRLTYESSRRLCALARGIMRGVGQHFGDALTIRQPECMLRGDPVCRFVVTVEPGDAG
jgi:predicted hydrocarbon binding protein